MSINALELASNLQGNQPENFDMPPLKPFQPGFGISEVFSEEVKQHQAAEGEGGGDGPGFGLDGLAPDFFEPPDTALGRFGRNLLEREGVQDVLIGLAGNAAFDFAGKPGELAVTSLGEIGQGLVNGDSFGDILGDLGNNAIEVGQKDHSMDLSIFDFPMPGGGGSGLIQWDKIIDAPGPQEFLKGLGNGIGYNVGGAAGEAVTSTIGEIWQGDRNDEPVSQIFGDVGGNFIDILTTDQAQKRENVEALESVLQVAKPWWL